MNIGDLVDAGYAEIKTGPFGTQLRASDYADTGRPVLNVRNVGFGDVRPKDFEFVDEATASRLSSHLLKPKDIVFGRKGAVERHAFITEKYDGAMQGSDCIRLRVSDDSPVPAEFLTFVLRTKQHQAWMQAFCSHGATMASLNQDIVRQIPMPRVDKASQNLAVAVLQGIDDLIENNRRRAEVLEEMARAIYREWFVKFRYPGHADVPMADLTIGRIPKGWSVGKLSDVAFEVRESAKPGELTRSLPYVPIDEIDQRSLTLRRSRPGEDAASSLRLFREGDVLFGAMRAYFHKVCLAPFDGVTRSTCLVLRAKPEWRVLPLFLLDDDETVAYASNHSSGSTIPYAKWEGVLSERAVALPPTALAAHFGSAVEPMLNQARFLVRQSDVLASLRDLLLPKLVTGQIDVSTLDLDAWMVERVAS